MWPIYKHISVPLYHHDTGVHWQIIHIIFYSLRKPCVSDTAGLCPGEESISEPTLNQ